MKRYLFGLGAMIVGAGLMFALMHGEVSADSKSSKPESFVCDESWGSTKKYIVHCETNTLDCGPTGNRVSCVKKGMFK